MIREKIETERYYDRTGRYVSTHVELFYQLGHYMKCGENEDEIVKQLKQQILEDIKRQLDV